MTYSPGAEGLVRLAPPKVTVPEQAVFVAVRCKESNAKFERQAEESAVAAAELTVKPDGKMTVRGRVKGPESAKERRKAPVAPILVRPSTSWPCRVDQERGHGLLP